MRTIAIPVVGRAIILTKIAGGIVVGIEPVTHLGTDSVGLSIGVVPVSRPRPRGTNTIQALGCVATIAGIAVEIGIVGHLGAISVGAGVGD